VLINVVKSNPYPKGILGYCTKGIIALLDFEIPTGKQSADRKSPMRLNSANAEIIAVVDNFEDTIGSRNTDNGKVEFAQAMLRLSFPSLENDNNIFTFSLRFPNKTIQNIAQEIYLYGIVGNTPAKNTKVAKAILSMCDADGVILYDSLEDFSKNFKLSGSVSKLYSILRENKSAFDLSKLSESLKGLELKVQSYHNAKLKDYTIATTDFVSNNSPKVSESNRTPRSKRGGSLW